MNWIKKFCELVCPMTTNDAELISCRTENEQLREQLGTAQLRIAQLLPAPPKNILDLLPDYVNKFGSKNWFYDYKGDGVLRNVKTALVASDEYFVPIAQELVEMYELQKGCDPTLVVEAVIKYFLNSRWTYLKDIDQFKKREYWETAQNSWRTRTGDCEDLGILMHVLISYLLKELSLEEHYPRLVLTRCMTLLENHLLNLWLWDDGEYYAIESTIDPRGSWTKTWKKCPVRYNNLYKQFDGYARNNWSRTGNNACLLPVEVK